MDIYVGSFNYKSSTSSLLCFDRFLYARSKTSDVLWYGVRPSVRLSVCPSVSHIMSAQYLEKFMSDSHGTW